MIKKSLFFCFFVVSISNATIPDITPKPWYVRIKELWNFFSNQKELIKQQKAIKQEYNQNLQNIFIALSTISNGSETKEELQNKIKQYNEDKKYLNIYFKSKHSDFYHDLKLSSEQILLFKAACNYYSINPTSIDIEIVTHLPQGVDTEIHFKNNRFQFLINQHSAWQSYSTEKIFEIFKNKIQYIIEGYIFDDENISSLVDHVYGNFKKQEFSEEQFNDTLSTFSEKIQKLINQYRQTRDTTIKKQNILYKSKKTLEEIMFLLDKRCNKKSNK